MTRRMMFLNLPVRDLARARSFFAALGFSFDPRFSDDRAACMVVSDAGFVMLLREEFFRTFTAREPCDATRQREALVALSAESRAEVDALALAAAEAGGAQAMPPVDRGFMYSRSFHDPDGHEWSIIWMDPEVAQEGPPREESRAEA